MRTIQIIMMTLAVMCIIVAIIMSLQGVPENNNPIMMMIGTAIISLMLWVVAGLIADKRSNSSCTIDKRKKW